MYVCAVHSLSHHHFLGEYLEQVLISLVNILVFMVITYRFLFPK